MQEGPLTRVVLALLAAVVVGAVAWQLLPPVEPEAGSAGGRIVSLSPPISETLFALGAGNQVVGRSNWDISPPFVQQLPAVGSALMPDVEAIARLRPSHIVTERTAGGPVSDLEALAPTTTLPWLTVDDAVASTQTLGVLTNRPTEAARLVARYRDTFGSAPEHDAPRVLATLGAEDVQRGEIWYVKPNSIHGAALEAAGLRNVVQRDVQGSPVMSLEELVRLDPDLILVLVPGDHFSEEQREEVVRAFDVAPSLGAVKAGAIRVLHGDDVLGTGPGVLDLVASIRRAATDAVSP